MRKSIVAAGLAAGFALLGPAAAFAADTPDTPAAPETAADHAPDKEHRPYVLPTAKTVHPGDKFTLTGHCYTEHPSGYWADEAAFKLVVRHVGPGRPGGTAQTVEVTWQVLDNAKPGTYVASVLCDGDEPSAEIKVVPKDKVKPAPPKETPKKEAVKQVAKVPAGAPQTGGSDDPADYTTLIAAVGAGVLVAGGAGIAVHRRRGAKQ
ncbi:hypothetical protein SAMN05421504_106462 [Amycolatopsis xylanica]|uniref:LPXTG-motif cell wall anchor domain-containing protein n=1 Tax=Amycolatopsis xylanica TaxID=589385 RepID=A0A1H3M2J0_9PSEU|nr:hypothetical protein [Amycolatopsis xylanica]SDY70786.1 hypothetical protein SAMN05421504_106462 [Amycolatopsis xylanica]